MDRATLSVRGEARATVSPDYVVVQVTLQAVPAGRSEVLHQLRARQDGLVAALRALGGAALSVRTDRDTLTWSFGSIDVHEEHDFDDATGRHGPTGLVAANLSAVITVRDLDRLPAVGEVLGATERLAVSDVSWHVDADNPAWPVVRADAIGVALSKARDYASALGGSVVRVDHVADDGLLSGLADHRSAFRTQGQPTAGFMSATTVDGGTPTLDPVPQRIFAVVEARVEAEIDPAVTAGSGSHPSGPPSA